MAISIMPLYGDAWKRRGQAKNALEDFTGASKVCSSVDPGHALAHVHAQRAHGARLCFERIVQLTYTQ